MLRRENDVVVLTEKPERRFKIGRVPRKRQSVPQLEQISRVANEAPVFRPWVIVRATNEHESSVCESGNGVHESSKVVAVGLILKIDPANCDLHDDADVKGQAVVVRVGRDA